MPSAEFEQSQSDIDDDQPVIQCDACQSAVRSDGQHGVSFLLLDQLTIPLVSCEEHLEQFSAICELTTDDTADILDHRPAGGICCPSCRLAPYNAAQPMIPVQGGAIVAMACPNHQSQIVQRFHAGLQTQHQLNSTLDTPTDSPL